MGSTVETRDARAAPERAERDRSRETARQGPYVAVFLGLSSHIPPQEKSPRMAIGRKMLAVLQKVEAASQQHLAALRERGKREAAEKRAADER